jgi:hypothetical protein
LTPFMSSFPFALEAELEKLRHQVG